MYSIYFHACCEYKQFMTIEIRTLKVFNLPWPRLGIRLCNVHTPWKNANLRLDTPFFSCYKRISEFFYRAVVLSQYPMLYKKSNFDDDNYNK